MSECYACQHRHAHDGHCYHCCDRLHGKEDAVLCKGAHPSDPVESHGG